MENETQRQDRKNQAYNMRLSGLTYREIGTRLGVSHVTARKWVTEHLADETLPLIEEVRKMEYDRMMRVLDRLEERALDGDDKALSLMIKVSERITKMLGADMPVVSITETHTVSELDLDIRRLIEAQNAQNAAAREKAANKGIAND
jgi:hypothetical protein